MDKENNKLQECFITAKIDIFESYFNMTLSIDPKNAKQPEHIGHFNYKGKNKDFILEKISLFKNAGYVFISDCSLPDFRTAMGLKE